MWAGDPRGSKQQAQSSKETPGVNLESRVWPPEALPGTYPGLRSKTSSALRMLLP